MPTISVANVELAEIAMKLANKTVKCTVKRACFVFRCSRGHRSGERMIFLDKKIHAPVGEIPVVSMWSPARTVYGLLISRAG